MQTNKEIRYMIESLSKDLIILMMDNMNMTMEQALDEFYRSETFRKLENPQTGLYYQSPLYVYSYLQKELTTGKYA